MKPGILLFVKQPEPGRVKTRLAASVGDREAARIYRWLVEQVCQSLPAEAALRVIYTPASAGGAIEGWLRPLLSKQREIHFEPQSEGDLGARLSGAFENGFLAGHPMLAAIGSDCIEITPQHFQESWEALGGNDAAIGGCHDGGYYLLALKNPQPSLFEGIPWSSPETLEATLRAAEAAGLGIYHLPVQSDVDTEEDVKRIPLPFMTISEPITFEPLYMERVWGGRCMESHFGRKLPNHARIGEAWELVDREEAQSVVHTGVFRGKTLHELWTELRAPIFGLHAPATPRFPLLFKLLDSQERLSVQVHPPAAIAPSLKGEPKTEMWYVAAATDDADIYAGLRNGVARDQFESALHGGVVAEKLHRIAVKKGDAIFIPSGRVHAIGAGNLIVEVQQNSDTTYRVFDWNRIGLDGKARELHIEESMLSIDFADQQPALATPRGEVIVECPYFKVEKWDLTAPRSAANAGEFAVFTLLTGSVAIGGVTLGAGCFFLVPAGITDATLTPLEAATTLLRSTIPASV